MRILLVAPALANVRARRCGCPLGARVFRTPPLGLMMVAAATPEGHSVRICDEHVEPVDVPDDVDLVGITVNACVANRAYEMARKFREKGKTVVMGGFHATFNPTEVQRECDAVVVGEAEPVWRALLEDVERGCLKKVYDGTAFGDLCLPIARRDLVRGRGYYFENVIQATRGCPHKCLFCGVNHFFAGKYRMRPVSEVVEDIRTMKGFRFLFTDDNLTAEHGYAKELFRQMIPLRKKWMGMTCLTVADDNELLELAARSGCVGLFLGFETVNPDNLAEVGKRQNRIAEYRRIRKRLHDHGISVTAGTIFGFEEDTPAVFESSLAAFLELGFDMIQVAPLTPFPGTPMHERYAREGRLLNRPGEDYDIYSVVYRPKNMTPEELANGLAYVRNGFYNLPLAIRRAVKALFYGGPVCAYMVLVLNLAYWRNHRAGVGYPP